MHHVVRSPYDQQLPSTSSSLASSLHPSPSSDAWTHGATGQSSVFGTMPEAPPMQQLQQEQQQTNMLQMQQDSLDRTGGRAMRQHLAQMRLASTAEWAGGSGYGSSAAAPTNAAAMPGSPSRTSSVLSLQSELSMTSAMSNLSTMTGLTVRTDFSDSELNRVANEKMLAAAPPIIAASLESDETPEERAIRVQVEIAAVDEVFNWTAVNGRMYRDYRKMVLRVYSKQNMDTKTGSGKTLKLLANAFPDQMAKILEDLLVDVRECGGEDPLQSSIRLDALHSLYDCVSVAPDNLATLFRPPRVGRQLSSVRDIIKCIDYRGIHSIAAARILIRLADPRYHDIRRAAVYEEGTQRMLTAVIYEKDVAPNKRKVLIEVLKKYNKKSAFLALGGIAQFLRFLDKEADERYLAAPVPKEELLPFLRVEKEEPLLHTVFYFLRSLVTTKSGSQKDCIRELAMRDGVHILSGWLEHGSNRLLHEIAQTLCALSTSTALEKKDLSVAIRRVIQLLGSDDPGFTYHLISFLMNLGRLSTAHKLAAVDYAPSCCTPSGRSSCARRLEEDHGGLCRELPRIISKWAEALIARPAEHSNGQAASAIYYSIEALAMLTDKDPERNAHTSALNALMREPNCMRDLMRAATFDFSYPTIRAMENADERNQAFDRAFDAHRPEVRAFELRAKHYALKVIQRLCMHAPDVSALGMSQVVDPLHREPLPILLWRRMWDMYRQVFLLSTRSTSPREDEIAPVLCTIQTVTQLASILYKDPHCFAQILPLVCVLISDPVDKAPTLNPLSMLASPIRVQWEAQFTRDVLIHMDVVIQAFHSHRVQTHTHPMLGWIRPYQGRDYKPVFHESLNFLRPYLPGDVFQRLTDFFNQSIGNESPAFTPGGFHMMQPGAGGYR
ncbi:hypothetical protein PFISCL1PPCAC_9528 [Pristionchus fissidentatus]|uniref:Uncharacterized protein n=1 Tax=Pristionchus fissidentatus TaxID=1538716 RepID=A0AAV5VHV2_9BILA|nr:hypothetical protein PFISCL1PPCAC_9528 [Pristionchus fissidentatus]